MLGLTAPAHKATVRPQTASTVGRFLGIGWSAPEKPNGEGWHETETFPTRRLAAQPPGRSQSLPGRLGGGIHARTPGVSSFGRAAADEERCEHGPAHKSCTSLHDKCPPEVRNGAHRFFMKPLREHRGRGLEGGQEGHAGRSHLRSHQHRHGRGVLRLKASRRSPRKSGCRRMEAAAMIGSRVWT